MTDENSSVMKECKDNPTHPEALNLDEPTGGRQLYSNGIVQAIEANRDLFTTLSSAIFGNMSVQSKPINNNGTISAFSSQVKTVNPGVSDEQTGMASNQVNPGVFDGQTGSVNSKRAAEVSADVEPNSRAKRPRGPESLETIAEDKEVIKSICALCGRRQCWSLLAFRSF